MNTRHEFLYRSAMLLLLTLAAVEAAPVESSWLFLGIILLAWAAGIFALVNGYKPEPAKDWRDIKASAELTREVVDAKIAERTQEPDGNKATWARY